MKNRYDSEATVNDILNVATTLFLEKGYEKTSIQDIVKGLDGLTRGAIYHHFASKDDIVTAVMRRLFLKDSFFVNLEARSDMNGLEKLQYVMSSALFDEDVRPYIKSGYELLKNPRFYVEYLRMNAEVVAPQVELLIIEANTDGSLDVAYPKYIAEAVVFLLTGWYVNAVYPVNEKEFMDKFHATRYLLNGIGLEVFSDELLKSLKMEKR